MMRKQPMHSTRSTWHGISKARHCLIGSHGFPAALRHGSEEANWVRRILFQKTFSEWNTLPRCMLSCRNHNFLEKTQ